MLSGAARCSPVRSRLRRAVRATFLATAMAHAGKEPLCLKLSSWSITLSQDSCSRSSASSLSRA